MFTQQLFSRVSVCLAAVCLSLAIPNTVQASPASYTVDPNLSTLNLSGSFSGFTFLPQSAGAMSDRFSGTIMADSSGGVLTFSGGSSITAQINPSGPFQPMSGGAAGSAPGNYGIAIPTIAEFGAYRGLVFDILSGTAMNGSAPAVTLSYSAGVLDYAGPATGPGQLSFAGASGPDSSALPTTLSTVAGIETLTLPFTFAISVPGGPQQTFDGTIVAFRQVPEPSTLAIGLAGAAILAWYCRFRRRR